MATKTKTVYVRMPAELYQRLEDEAEARGETVSVVIRECTRKHLDALEIHDQPAANAADAAGKVVQVIRSYSGKSHKAAK